MTDEGADKKNSCHELSCVPGSLLEAGDTRVNKRVKNPSFHLPGESHGQKSLASYRLWDHRVRLD